MHHRRLLVPAQSLAQIARHSLSEIEQVGKQDLGIEQRRRLAIPGDGQRHIDCRAGSMTKALGKHERSAAVSQFGRGAKPANRVNQPPVIGTGSGVQQCLSLSEAIAFEFLQRLRPACRRGLAQ